MGLGFCRAYGFHGSGLQVYLGKEWPLPLQKALLDMYVRLIASLRACVGCVVDDGNGSDMKLCCTWPPNRHPKHTLTNI